MCVCVNYLYIINYFSVCINIRVFFPDNFKPRCILRLQYVLLQICVKVYKTAYFHIYMIGENNRIQLL